MTNLKITSILVASSVLLFAETALAGEKNAPETYKTKAVKVTATANTKVLSTRTENLIPVKAQDGEIFYNQLVDYDDLPDVELEAEVVDTYEVTYEGRTYTNKVMK